MRRLSGWDAYMLYSETPTVHNHTLKVAIVGPDGAGKPLSFERFRRTLAADLPRLDPLHFELVTVPAGLHHPMWRENASVNLDRHVLRVEAPYPGDRRRLDDIVGDIASVPLDRKLPLWSFHFIEGLAGSRVAIVAKVHHALADGIASANLLGRAVAAASIGDTPNDAPDSDAAPRAGEILRAAVRDYARSIRLLPQVLVATIAGIRRSQRDAAKPPAGDARILRAPATFFNRKLSGQRAFGTASLSLSTAKATCTELGITINDLILALAAGALREMFIVRDLEPVAVVGAVAVATNRDPNRISGNHLAAMITSLPADEADPLQRCARVHASTTVAKHNLDVLGMTLVEHWMEFIWPKTSAMAFHWLSSRSSRRNRMVNLPLSNVPGPREQGSVAGHPLVDLYSVGPLYDRCGINITVWSYVDRLNVSVLTDPLIVSDPAAVAELMVDGLDELRSALERRAQ